MLGGVHVTICDKCGRQTERKAFAKGDRLWCRSCDRIVEVLGVHADDPRWAPWEALDPEELPGPAAPVMAVETEIQPPEPTQEQAPPVGPFIVRPVSAIFCDLPPVPWLCEPLGICPGAPTLIAGYGYSGKTVAAQALAIAVAAGTKAWGTFTVRQGSVVHLDYEQGWRLTAERYQRLCRAEMLGPAALGDRLGVVSMPDLYLDQPAAADALCWLFDGRALAIVDSYRASSPGIDENDSAARIVLDKCTRASDKTGCSCMVLLHARKPTKDAKGGARMAIRGTSGLYDACASALILSGEKGEPVLVQHDKERTTGRTLDDFQLVIEDEECDGDPRGGLIVRAQATLEGSNGKAAEIPTAVQERVLAIMQEQGSVPSFNALVELTRMSRARVRGTLDLLIASGKVIERSLGQQKREYRFNGQPVSAQ